MVVELNQYHNSKNRIFDWDEFIFYSSSTIAIWIYELDKISLDEQDMDQGDLSGWIWYWLLGRIIGLANVERNITDKEIELIYIGNTQILILEFE
jgi:hypothetical protein